MNYVINILYTILIPTFNIYWFVTYFYLIIMENGAGEKMVFSVLMVKVLYICICFKYIDPKLIFFTFLIRDIIFSLPRVNISWKCIIFFKTDCQWLFYIITLLNHINFRLLMNAFRLNIWKPPWQYCFTTILCFIFAGPSHKYSKNMLFNSFSIWSVGFGIDINRWFKIDRSSDFITVILSNGVKYRLFRILISDLIFCIFSLKFIPCVLSRSTWKFIPKSLNSVLPHDSFHLVLIDEVLYLLISIHTACVFSKFTFNPENFEYSNNTSSVAFKDLLLPSKMNDVPSAYCDSLCSLLFIIIQLIFLLFLIIIAKISAQRMKKKVDTGSPWRHPRPILKKDDRLPHWFTLSLTFWLNNFIQAMTELPKPKNPITL